MFTLKLFSKCLTHIPLFTEFLFNILKTQTCHFFPWNIYCNLCVSSCSLWNIKWGISWKRTGIKKSDNQKSFPPVTDSMVSTSQMASLHQTQSPHSELQEPVMLPNCPAFFYALLMLPALPVVPVFTPLSSPSQRPSFVHPHAWKQFQNYLPSTCLNYS